MRRAFSAKFAAFFPWFAGCFSQVQGVRCTYRFGPDGTIGFLCKKSETCCYDSCCPQAEAFYNLWYFWFSTVVFTMFISGVVYTCWQRCKMIKETDAWVAGQMATLKLHRIVESAKPRPASEEDFSIA